MKICVAGSSISVTHTGIEFVQKLRKQKHIKPQQRSTGEITEMWTSRKAFPQELSSNRISHKSSKLHLFLFLLLRGREKGGYCCGRCPCVQFIGQSCAGGPVSHRWCPVFNLA